MLWPVVRKNMSRSPHCIGIRDGVKFGNVELQDTMIVDGLWDVFNDYHMGVTAEKYCREISGDA